MLQPWRHDASCKEQRSVSTCGINKHCGSSGSSGGHGWGENECLLKRAHWNPQGVFSSDPSLRWPLHPTSGWKSLWQPVTFSGRKHVFSYWGNICLGVGGKTLENIALIRLNQGYFFSLCKLVPLIIALLHPTSIIPSYYHPMIDSV